ncbi:hypothetical protein JTB14_015693 [Gonioctena quinquepunctata]|nr:hypothetical protein JTB14_015693 [Gonioctena quinquepunctata]
MTEGEYSRNQCQATTENPTVTSHVFNNFVDNQVLLSTAVVRIKDHRGQLQLARVLLDNGSQSSFITEELCQRLNLKRSPTNLAIRGIQICREYIIEKHKDKTGIVRICWQQFSQECLKKLQQDNLVFPLWLLKEG